MPRSVSGGGHRDELTRRVARLCCKSPSYIQWPHGRGTNMFPPKGLGHFSRRDWGGRWSLIRVFLYWRCLAATGVRTMHFSETRTEKVSELITLVKIRPYHLEDVSSSMLTEQGWLLYVTPFYTKPMFLLARIRGPCVCGTLRHCSGPSPTLAN